MARVLKPPTPIDVDLNRPTIFLAGSIEMGSADDWQTALCDALADLDVLILNPRRDAWDSTWRQSIDEDRFREQVEWELEGQERATVIALYFAPATRSPVTLLELGLFARSGKIAVCCPDGFWRKGNVEVVCARYDIPLMKDRAALIAFVRDRVAEHG